MSRCYPDNPPRAGASGEPEQLAEHDELLRERGVRGAFGAAPGKIDTNSEYVGDALAAIVVGHRFADAYHPCIKSVREPRHTPVQDDVLRSGRPIALRREARPGSVEEPRRATSLREALTQLERLGVDDVVCAGDLLDWGPSPGRCIELLQERRIPCVRGNHDFLDAGGGIFEPAVLLSGKALAFIDALPRSLEPDDRVDLGAILETAATDVLVVGHTHKPMHLSSPRGSTVNPGSLLRQPPSTETNPASGTFVSPRRSPS